MRRSSFIFAMMSLLSWLWLMVGRYIVQPIARLAASLARPRSGDRVRLASIRMPSAAAVIAAGITAGLLLMFASTVWSQTHVRPGLPNGSTHARLGLPAGSTHAVPDPPATGATYYISPTGNDTTGDGSSGSPWATPVHAYASMVGGDTLIIKNGTYSNVVFLTDNPSQHPPIGSAGAYTTVRAETDGGVIFDGTYTTDNFGMGNTTSPPLAYITIRGIQFKRQSLGSGMYGSNHIKIEFCGFEGATTGNAATFGLSHCSYCLVEDCWFYGATGRYKMLFYLSDHMVARGCIVRSDGANAPNWQVCDYVVYSTTYWELQNCISLDMAAISKYAAPIDPAGSFSFPSGSGVSDHGYARSCIAYNTTMQAFTAGADNGTTCDMHFIDFVAYNTLEIGTLRNGLLFNHCSLGPCSGPALAVPNLGIDYYASTNYVQPQVTNSILQGIPGTALNDCVEDSNDFFGNTSNRGVNTLVGAHSITTNPARTYPFRIETTSSLYTAGSDGGTIGANIRKRIGAPRTLWGDTNYYAVQSQDAFPMSCEAVAAVAMNAYVSPASGTGSNPAGIIRGDRDFASSGNIAAHSTKPLTIALWGSGGPY